MCLTNIVYHQYMCAYSRVTSLSFVDNLEGLGDGIQKLHEGINTLQAWAQLFHVELDRKKSYTWASNAALRAQCARLGWECKTHAKDLGAPMTYGAKHSVVEQMDRIKSLRPIWTLFKRLRAPLWIKQRLLVQALWPRAFYGSNICCMSWDHIKHICTDAMKGLAQHRGGASPGMRLAVLSPPATDPDYYQFWHTLRTFRRVSRKQRGFRDLWCIFMHHFQGKPSFGPFGKL